MQSVNLTARKQIIVYILPDILSSSLIKQSLPLDTTFNLPVQSGASNFQSAALKLCYEGSMLNLWVSGLKGLKKSGIQFWP